MKIKVQVTRFMHERDIGFDTQWLSMADRARLAHMRTPANRERFLFTRKTLYQVVSEATGIEPSAVRIGVGQYGKPYLASHPHSIDFSLSHSREFLAIATSIDGHVGIDIEDHPLRGPPPSLAAVCSVDELEALARTSDVDFLSLWTKKEAFLKLNGVGLAVAPKDVNVAQGRTARYCGAAPLPYLYADVEVHKVDRQYVLAVASPWSKAVELVMASMDDLVLFEK